MKLRTLDLASLAELDEGIMNAAFRLELKKMVADMENRPALKKPRTITLKVTMVPEDLDGPSGLDGVEFGCEISSKAPNRQTKAYSMKAGSREELLFKDDSLENPNQMTVDDELERNEDDAS